MNIISHSSLLKEKICFHLRKYVLQKSRSLFSISSNYFLIDVMKREA